MSDELSLNPVDVVGVMLETKKQTKERLLSEGRWEEAWKYRDLLKLRGASPEDAWAQMVLAYQPDDGRQVTHKKPSPASKPSKRPKMNWKDQIEWVYRHLEEEKPTYPRGGLKGFHLWARENRSEFFKTFVARLAGRGSGPSEVEAQQVVSGALDLVEKFMAEHGEKS